MKRIMTVLISFTTLIALTACEDLDAEKDQTAYFVLSESLCRQPEMTSLPVDMRPGQHRVLLTFMEIFSFTTEDQGGGTMKFAGGTHRLLGVTRCLSPKGDIFLNLECDVDGAPRSLAMLESYKESTTHELLRLDKTQLKSAGAPLDSFAPQYPEKRFVEINPHNADGVFILDFISKNSGSFRVRVTNP